jgi:hypothetical protein
MRSFRLRFLCFISLVHFNASGQTVAGTADCFQGVTARGDQSMGFSHEKTTHHFHLFADGGAIEIQINEAGDARSQEAIRQHLAMIATRFSHGDFAIPMFIHATVPPGVETMKRLSREIAYKAESTGYGAELRITARSAKAIDAIHRFLRFQIQDHHTGDSFEVQK